LGLALEVAELVNGTALDQGLGPHEPDSLAQARVAVDHADHRGAEATGDEIVQAALPGLERLAPAELQRDELLLAIGENGDHAEDRDAGHLPGARDPQGDGVKVEAENVHIGQRPGTPGLQLRLERAHDPRDGTL
jgi:hypothetical protein